MLLKCLHFIFAFFFYCCCIPCCISHVVLAQPCRHWLVGRKRKTEALFSLALHHHAIVVYFIVDCCLFLVFRFQSKSFTYHLFNDRYISYRHVMFKSYLSPIASSREEKTGEKQKTTGEV